MDEPTAGLDPEERVRFRNLLCEIAQERIVILSTHIVGDIEATCENIAVLNQGEILYQGTVEQMLENAQGKIYTAEISKKELETMKQRYTVTGMLTMGCLLYTSSGKRAAHCHCCGGGGDRGASGVCKRDRMRYRSGVLFCQAHDDGAV